MFFFFFKAPNFKADLVLNGKVCLLHQASLNHVLYVYKIIHPWKKKLEPYISRLYSLKIACSFYNFFLCLVSVLQEYLVLQKSCKVDVDSSGKKCKEKMISVLCDFKLPQVRKR